MQPQTPAQGILLNRNYGDAMQYTVVCECGDSDHNHNVWVEADDGMVTVTVYTTAKTQWWKLNRWQTIWRLLTRGYVEYEADIIMNEQQAINYAETLKVAAAQSKEFRDRRMEKK